MPAAPTLTRMSATHEGDQSVLDRLLVGDDTALGVLYDSYSSVMVAIAARVLGSRTAAEDVLQEVFCEVWSRPDRIDLTRGSIKTYLTVMAHRRAVDAVRRTVATSAREDRVGRADPARRMDNAPDTMVVDADDAAGRAAAVGAALERLPEAQRDAIRLAYFGGHSYREVAAQLSIPEGTAKSRLRLGLARLREELNREGLS